MCTLLSRTPAAGAQPLHWTDPENKAAFPRADLANNRVRSEPELLTHLFQQPVLPLSWPGMRGELGCWWEEGWVLMLTKGSPPRPCSDLPAQTAAWWAVVTPFLHEETEGDGMHQLAQSHPHWGRMGLDQKVWLWSLNLSGVFYTDPL